jgi:hypothetical protein
MNKVNLPNNVIEDIINNWVHSERDRAIMHRRFIDGIKVETLAVDFDLSVRQINNILFEGKMILEDKKLH